MSEQQTLDTFARQVAQILKRLLRAGKRTGDTNETDEKEKEGQEAARPQGPIQRLHSAGLLQGQLLGLHRP